MCEQQKNKPHVHAELIKAWADGAIIERLLAAGWTVCSNPQWDQNATYRIQPPKKSPGQVAFEAYAGYYESDSRWEDITPKCWSAWETVAQAVIDSLKQK